MAFDPLNPLDLVQYDTRGNQLRNQYGQGQAQNTYKRSQLDISHQRAVDQLGQQFYDFRQKIPGSFIGRGLLNSGLYSHALSEYSRKKLQGQNDLNLDYSGQVGGLDLEKLGLEQNLSGGLAGLEAEKQARRAQLAAQLREMA